MAFHKLDLTDSADRKTAALTILSIRAGSPRWISKTRVLYKLITLTRDQARQARDLGMHSDWFSLDRICCAAQDALDA